VLLIRAVGCDYLYGRILSAETAGLGRMARRGARAWWRRQFFFTSSLFLRRMRLWNRSPVRLVPEDTDRVPCFSVTNHPRAGVSDAFAGNLGWIPHVNRSNRAAPGEANLSV